MLRLTEGVFEGKGGKKHLSGSTSEKGMKILCDPPSADTEGALKAVRKDAELLPAKSKLRCYAEEHKKSEAAQPKRVFEFELK